MLHGKGLSSALSKERGAMFARGLSVSAAPSHVCDLSARLSSLVGSHVDFRIYINLDVFNDKRVVPGNERYERAFSAHSARRTLITYFVFRLIFIKRGNPTYRCVWGGVEAPGGGGGRKRKEEGDRQVYLLTADAARQSSSVTRSVGSDVHARA